MRHYASRAPIVFGNAHTERQLNNSNFQKCIFGVDFLHPHIWEQESWGEMITRVSQRQVLRDKTGVRGQKEKASERVPVLCFPMHKRGKVPFGRKRGQRKWNQKGRKGFLNHLRHMNLILDTSVLIDRQSSAINGAVLIKIELPMNFWAVFDDEINSNHEPKYRFVFVRSARYICMHKCNVSFIFNALIH